MRPREPLLMEYLEILQRLAVALSIGLLIGLERGWTMLGEGEGERTAGLRTLGLAGLLGGLSALLAMRIEQGGVVLAASFVSYSAILATYRFREVQRRKTYGTTTVIAGLVTFVLGALAMVVEPIVVAAAGVATAALLALKPVLHGWLKAITGPELRAGLTLLVMSVIMLPVLPDKGYGPFGALNPYDLWRMTVLIAAVSSLGYFAIKFFDGAQGIAISGMAGGLVSSTATTLTFSKMAREHPDRAGMLMAGALLASAVMFGRIVLVAGTINPSLLRWLLLPLGLAGLAVGAFAAYLIWRGEKEQIATPLTLASPFELSTVLKFGAFLAFIMFAAKVLTVLTGTSGAYLLAAVSGIADVDALTLTMSRLAGNGIAEMAASLAILLAAGVNTISKTVLGWLAGGEAAGRTLAAGAVTAALAAIAGFAASYFWDPMHLYNAMGGA